MVLSLAISTTTISYIVIFPAIIKLRYSHPHVPRPYRVPGGKAMPWIAGCLCTGWAIFATVVLVYPGFGTASPDDALPGGFTRTQIELSQIIPLAVFFIGGLLFFVAGAGTRRHAVQVPIAEEMGVSAAGQESA